MAVKIFIGGEDAVPALLAKQKASWEKLEKSSDDFGKSAAKAQRAAVAHGKSLVKQNRTAEQTLKDRVAAVQEAAKKEEITQREKIDTIRSIIGKYREEGQAAKEAAEKGTAAYKEEQRQISEGKRKVEQLKTVNKSLDQQYDELRRSIKKAFDAGELEVDQYKTALRELQAEQTEVAAKSKKATLLSSASKAVASIGLISLAWQKATEFVQFYNAEKEKAVGATDSLVDTRRSLRQISRGDFDQLEGRADDLTKYGITRTQGRELVFAGRSTGFEGEEATVARADPVIEIGDGAAFAGEFRKFFSDDNLSIEQAFNTALAGAAESKFNISELLPQVRTAAQGALSGGESSDVVAATSVLADNFGRQTGDRLRALGGKLAQDDATRGLNLIDAVRKLQGDKGLRDSILKDSSELNAVFAKFSERIEVIASADKRIEKEQQRGDGKGLLDKALKEALDGSTDSGRIEIARRRSIAAEQQSLVQLERNVSSDAFQAKTALSRSAENRFTDGSTSVERFLGSQYANAASSITSDRSTIEGVGGLATAVRQGRGGEAILQIALERFASSNESIEASTKEQADLMREQVELAKQQNQGTLSRPGVDQ